MPKDETTIPNRATLVPHTEWVVEIWNTSFWSNWCISPSNWGENATRHDVCAGFAVYLSQSTL